MCNTRWLARIALVAVLSVRPLGGLVVSGKASAAPPAEGATVGSINTDPARLARIRATKMPEITKPVMFYSPEADAICSALEVFPPDNPWNQVIDAWPLHPNSDAIITSIGQEKPFRCNMDMSFVLVPPDQKRVDVKKIAILKGLKKYGMFVADNGIDWAISVAPDPRIPDMHAELRKVKGSAFEVIVAPQ